jgi:hypothetical protein
MIIYLALVAVGRPFQNEGSMVVQSLAGRLQYARTAKTRVSGPAAAARASASCRVRAALKMNRTSRLPCSDSVGPAQSFHNDLTSWSHLGDLFISPTLAEGTVHLRDNGLSNWQVSRDGRTRYLSQRGTFYLSARSTPVNGRQKPTLSGHASSEAADRAVLLGSFRSAGQP